MSDLKNAITTIYAPLFGDLLRERAADDRHWSELLADMHRFGLLEVVTFEQWSKFQLKRHPIRLDREQLHQPGYLDPKTSIIADNWAQLLARDAAPEHLLVLPRQTTKSLARTLNQVWTSRATARHISERVLAEELAPDIDNAMSGALTEMDKRFAVYSRISERQHRLWQQKLEARIDRQAESAHELVNLIVKSGS